MAHLTSTDREAVARFSADVRRSLAGRVHSIQVFGSNARGDATDDSDVDVLVVLADIQQGDRWEISRLAGNALDSGVLISPAVLSAEQVERMKRRRNMFWQSIEPDLMPL